jgi:hypothetical protein
MKGLKIKKLSVLEEDLLRRGYDASRSHGH